ncbi:MAG: 16S rRNA (guanine(966)-N(2))-methyltransferase RsmD [Pseudomonadota bacterium]
MRVIGGSLGGQKLVSPSGKNTRPTTDRVRENLFNILESRVEFEGKRILDLFAGSGAFGIEALSRGGEFALFVEQAGPARAVIRENVENLSLTGKTRIFRRDATRLGSIGTMRPFDLVFADPPYETGLGQKAAESLFQGGWLASNAMFILEERRSALPENIEGFDLIDTRAYGDTAIALFEYGGG